MEAGSRRAAPSTMLVWWALLRIKKESGFRKEETSEVSGCWNPYLPFPAALSLPLSPPLSLSCVC